MVRPKGRIALACRGELHSPELRPEGKQSARTEVKRTHGKPDSDIKKVGKTLPF